MLGGSYFTAENAKKFAKDAEEVLRSAPKIVFCHGMHGSDTERILRRIFREIPCIPFSACWRRGSSLHVGFVVGAAGVREGVHRFRQRGDLFLVLGVNPADAVTLRDMPE